MAKCGKPNRDGTPCQNDITSAPSCGANHAGPKVAVAPRVASGGAVATTDPFSGPGRSASPIWCTPQTYKGAEPLDVSEGYATTRNDFGDFEFWTAEGNLIGVIQRGRDGIDLAGNDATQHQYVDADGTPRGPEDSVLKVLRYVEQTIIPAHVGSSPAAAVGDGREVRRKGDRTRIDFNDHNMAIIEVEARYGTIGVKTASSLDGGDALLFAEQLQSAANEIHDRSDEAYDVDDLVVADPGAVTDHGDRLSVDFGDFIGTITREDRHGTIGVKVHGTLAPNQAEMLGRLVAREGARAAGLGVAA